DTCSCQTARCFNKSKGVLITGSKLKAFRNPQPSWGFSVHNKAHSIEAVGFLHSKMDVIWTLKNKIHLFSND
ncbi:hypothetical protein, partial [Escherichia coli]|uniref:hypothetical protein n=1 Tax=Escherichia coli TaxID=562 RepID=UPI0036D9C5E0